MSGRPVRRRVLADVERQGGWAVVLARIASGESVAGIGRSFGVSPGFFSRLLHEDRDRHALAVEARWRATGHKLLAGVPDLLDRFVRSAAPTAARSVEVGEVATEEEGVPS